MKRKYKIILPIIVIVLAGLIIAIKIVADSQANLDQLAATDIQNVDLKNVTNGVYKGECNVFPISVIVDVTVSDHKITKIDLVKHTNGKGAPAEILTDKVLEKQSLNVDTVSGATYSSKAILKAIENALLKK